MLEHLRLLDYAGQSIVLQTRAGRDIENLIEPEPQWRHIQKYRALFEKFRLGWQERRPPAGGCNCVGHVWASRRTGVFAPELERKVLMIFEDDGYRVVNWPNEPLAIGDLVTYWDSILDRKGFWHVGLVVELRRSTLQGAAPIPYVLSKWDATSGEVLHHFRDCPFPNEVQPEFWTDRPIGGVKI